MAGHQSQRKERNGPSIAGPVRTCVGCGQGAAQKELLRFVLGADGEVIADLGHRSFGRGIWVHPRHECLGRAQSHGFKRALRRAVEVPMAAILGAITRASERQIIGLLTGARGARALIGGSDAVREQGTALELLIIAADARAAAQQNWVSAWSARGRCVVWGTKAGFGVLFGREEVAVLGLMDAGIAKALLTAIGVARLATDVPNGQAELSEVQ